MLLQYVHVVPSLSVALRHCLQPTTPDAGGAVLDLRHEFQGLPSRRVPAPRRLRGLRLLRGRAASVAADCHRVPVLRDVRAGVRAVPAQTARRLRVHQAAGSAVPVRCPPRAHSSGVVVHSAGRSGSPARAYWESVLKRLARRWPGRPFTGSRISYGPGGRPPARVKWESSKGRLAKRATARLLEGVGGGMAVGE